MNSNTPPFRVVALLACCAALGAPLGQTATTTAPAVAEDYPRTSRPPFFSYEELLELGSAHMRPELVEKLHTVTTTPFVSNEAYYQGARPRPLQVQALGPVLRVAFWNIERGLHLDDIQLLLSDKERFMARVAEERQHAKESGHTVRDIALEKLPEEIDILQASDVWILNEVDWGVKRTDYREVIRELGESLHMNWAYGVEFVEIDPKQLGTDAFDDGEDEQSRKQLLDEFAVDKNRLRALHGNAVLSRYPIRAAQLIPFTVGYEWFKESEIRPLEKGVRKAAVLVGEDLAREVRRGQRTSLIVDLDVPGAPDQTMTVVSTHLENRTKPTIRRQQLQELLTHIRDNPHPVVLAGDFNTTGGDSTPTSVEYMLYKKFGSLDFWTTKGIQWTTGVGLVYSAPKALRKLAGIQYRVDPTSANVPGVSANQERALFTTLEQFRFEDGTAFDFRGVPDRTVGRRSGTLGDSNERASKGFAPSFAAELIYGKVQVAKFKLDWIVVKSDLYRPRDLNGPYRFGPHFGRTLTDVNNSLPEPLADHSPMTVDLPFNEPPDLTRQPAGPTAGSRP